MHGTDEAPQASARGVLTRGDPELLPTLALSRPGVALQQARHLLDSSADDRAASYAHQAIGIVLRDAGEVGEALVQLREGLRAAQRSGDAGRVIDLRATRGAALVMAGRTRAGLDELAHAARDARGPVAARVRLRRAISLYGVGRHEEALRDIRSALAGTRSSGDLLWEARALNIRAVVNLDRGEVAGAAKDLDRAGGLFADLGQDFEVATIVQNRGVIAFCRGDLPTCLSYFAEAASAYDELGASVPELVVERCQALLACGLVTEAFELAEEALAAGTLSQPSRAEILMMAATAALAQGDPEAALSRGRRARDLFRHQQREWWHARAEMVVIRARRLRGDSGPRMAAEAGDLARRLTDLRADDAPVALVIAGKLAKGRRPAAARAYFDAAARFRRNASALTCATGWLGTALMREVDGNGAGVLRACSRGLDALDEHRSTLGSSELRALATTHGTELATLAIGYAARSGSARRLLAWSERWRATSLAEPPVRPPSGRAGDDLALLRSRARLVDEARRDGRDGAAEARRRAATERAVRERRHQLAGVRDATRNRFDVRELVAELGDATFIELVVVDEILHAIVVRNGRVTSRVVGPLAAADEAMKSARFVLRQIARERPGDVSGLGVRLQRTLLGSDVPGDGSVVIAPPGRLHAAPWALLPTLGDRAISLVPSATMWLRARRVAPPVAQPLVLVAGPGLGTGGAEVDHLARSTHDAQLLRDGTATVEATLAALDGASLAHVAAHGQFRADSPMFSSLILDDGPLTVHDLETLDRAPYRLVLSACDSGVMAPVGADELLGLTAALLSMGTAGVVCSVAEVNDAATVDLMLTLHAEIARGSGLAEALLAARREAGDDPLARASAASFVALGA